MLYQYAVHNYFGKQQHVLSFFPVIQQYVQHVCLHLASIDASPPGFQLWVKTSSKMWGFCPQKMGELVLFVFVATCYLFILNSCVGRLRQLLTFMSWWSMVDIVIWQPCLTKPIWFVWEGTACSGSRSSSWLPLILLQRQKIWKNVPWKISASVGFFGGKLMTSPCHVKPQVWT